jgi:hypothetical protein
MDRSIHDDEEQGIENGVIRRFTGDSFPGELGRFTAAAGSRTEHYRGEAEPHDG